MDFAGGFLGGQQWIGRLVGHRSISGDDWRCCDSSGGRENLVSQLAWFADILRARSVEAGLCCVQATCPSIQCSTGGRTISCGLEHGLPELGHSPSFCSLSIALNGLDGLGGQVLVEPGVIVEVFDQLGPKRRDRYTGTAAPITFLVDPLGYARRGTMEGPSGMLGHQSERFDNEWQIVEVWPAPLTAVINHSGSDAGDTCCSEFFCPRCCY